MSTSWYMVAGSQNPISWTKTVTISSTCHAEVSRQKRSHQVAKDGIQGNIEAGVAMKDMIPSAEVWDNGKRWYEKVDRRGIGSIVGVFFVAGKQIAVFVRNAIQLPKRHRRVDSRQDLIFQSKWGTVSMVAFRM